MARAVLVGMLVGVLALAGCTTLAQLGDLRSDLESAGYDTRAVNHNTSNGHDTLRIEATAPDGTRTGDAADEIAEIVWTTYPAEVDELEVTVNGQLVLDVSDDVLTDRFGDRPADLAVEEDSDMNTVTVIVVTAVVVLLLVGLMVLVWMRGRRRLPPTEPPVAQQPPDPYQNRPHFPAGP